MKRTISALWHGELAKIDCLVCSNSLMEDLEQDIDRIKQQLAASLQKEQAADFATYVRFNREYIELSAEQAFISGFRVAVRLMAESFGEEW